MPSGGIAQADRCGRRPAGRGKRPTQQRSSLEIQRVALAARPLLTAARRSVLSRTRGNPRARLRWVALVLLGALSACIRGGSTMPAVSPQGTLGLGAEDARGKSDGPFRVVYSGPEGEASAGSEISLVFSRALRELSLAGDEAPPPVKLTPDVPGRWQWVGTRALVFVAAGGHLPGATRISVEVPGSTKALDGSPLGKPYRFAFTTPRPRVVRSSPWDGANGLEPKTTVELRFNQPIDPEALRRVTHVSAVRGVQSAPIAFSVRHKDPQKTKLLELVPTSPLPIHSEIRVEIEKGLTSQEGPLSADNAYQLRFHTYGPLVVDRLSCDRDTPHKDCAPGGSIGLSLSNPVKIKSLRAAIRVSPPVPLRWDSWREDDDLTSYVDLVGPFKPGRSYTISVAPTIVDNHGQRMAKPFSQTERIDDLWPTVEVGVEGDVLEPKLMRPITVGSVNVKSYELVSRAVTPKEVLELGTLSSSEKQFDALAKSGVRTVQPQGATNRLVSRPVDTGKLLGSTHRGAVAIGVRYQQRKDTKRTRVEHEVRVVQVTDLALTAKLSRHGSVVWVTRLSNGAPVPKAEVRVLRRGKPDATVMADDLGIAQIPESVLSPRFYDSGDRDALLVAKSGDDWAYRMASDYLSPWRLDVPTDLSGDERALGLIFTERGIYRPGDQVMVKGIVRMETATGNGIPSGKRLTLTLQSPDGESLGKQALTTSRFGTFDAKVRVPKSGALGSYQLRVEGLGEQAMGQYFEVQEYRPVEFKVGVDSDRPEYVRGQSAKWTVHGDYLFGAPMAKAAARATVTRASTWFSPADSEGYSTRDDVYYADLDDESMSSAMLEDKRGTLDEKGTLSLAADLAMPGQRNTEIVTVDAEVTDVSRQTVAGSTAALVHPASFYLGVQDLPDYFVDAPGNVKASIVALTPKGGRVAGKKVHVDLVRRRWTVARQDAGGGRVHSVSKPVDTVMGGCDVVTGQKPVACSIAVPEGGYFFLHAKGKDERGNPVSASQSFFGIGAGGASWRDDDRRKLELALNKKEYHVGDQARVLVKNPFPNADALVTVERAGVYHTKRVKLSGPTPTVTVPVTDELRPNAFVSVHLVRGRTGGAPARGKADVGAPDFRVGYAELSIDPEARRLTVDVTPDKTELRPGQTVNVGVRVRDAAGKPKSAEVTLYAVDEGVLSLIGYKTPDPLPVFTAPRPLQVATVESRDSLAKLGLGELGSALGLDKGLDGGDGGEGSSVRRDFRQSAYFNPKLVTGTDGTARVSFKIPESLTTYRLMAVATSTDDRYGFGDSRVVTSKKLMARPALPRFVRTGDAFEAGVVVSAKHFGPAEVTVNANVTGLELGGPGSQTIQLERDESREVRFPMRAKTSGDAKLSFMVSGGGQRDAVEVRRSVSVPTVMESVALYGKTDKAAGEKLGDLRAMRTDVGDLTLTVASSALVGLEGGVDQLVEYPYGCTEQLSSRLMPLLPLRDLAKDFSIPLPKNVDGVVEKTVAELVARQKGDGGFGMWPDSPESSPWISAYALWTLHQAKGRGAVVPPRVLERGTSYVRSYLARLRDDPLYLSTAAFVVDVLAETGAPDVGYMGRLFERRKELPMFAQALLLHALSISKQKAELIDPLVRELEGSLFIEANAAYVKENLGDEYAVLMDSPARSSALVLRALVAARPSHPLAAELARGLLLSRRGGTWRSTQETAFALLALDAYRKAQEKVVPDYDAKVWLSGKELLSTTMKGRSVFAERQVIGAGKVAGSGGGLLVFQKEGAGTLFYEARLRYARRTLPARPLDRGFYIQKTLRPVSPEGLPDAMSTIPEVGATRFPAGSLVLADLVIVTPTPRQYVVVEDPLPAGLEAVNSQLSTTAAWLNVPGSESSEQCWECDEQDDELAHGTAFLDSWYRRELRDDRVLFFVDHMPAGMYHYRYLARATTPGRFVLPPAKAEEMYTPEVFGRTGALSVEVK
ncbi:MAG: Ig-like domain-containing protein [Polyangiaceae bacterium]|nr:Ig-like domain-containing protein [Polyangiaceae bacterium]